MNRAVIVFLVLAQAAVLEAKNDRASLRGLKAFGVFVGKVDKEAEDAGLSTEMVKTDVELRLRKAGVRVGDLSPETNLFVQVIALSLSTGQGWAFSITVGLYQPVTLDRDKSNSGTAQTWSLMHLGLAPNAQFVSGVRSALGDLVDRFINDYLAANQH